METVVPGSGKRGRARVWCSDACRQRGYRARKAGAHAVESGIAPSEDSPAPAGPMHALDQCIVAVLESPPAVASVLDVLRRALNDDVLERQEYAEVQVALVALREALDPDER